MKGRAGVITQKLPLTIRAAKMPQPLERDARQEKQQCPQLPRCPLLVLAQPSLQLWGDLHWDPTRVSSAMKSLFQPQLLPQPKITTWLHKHLCQHGERGRGRNNKSSWSQMTEMLLKAVQFHAIMKMWPKPHIRSTVGSLKLSQGRWCVLHLLKLKLFPELCPECRC